jgi:hypothetical protein
MGPVYFHGETMRPLLGEGDRIIVQPVEWNEIRPGDIVTYRFEDKFPTRRVIDIQRERDLLIIRGDSIRDWPDYRVRREDVLGRAEVRLRDGQRIDRQSPEWRRAARRALLMQRLVNVARRSRWPVRGLLFRLARQIQFR